MLSSLITEAKLAVDDERKEISMKDEPGDEAKEVPAQPRAESKNKACSGEEMVHKVSEYLFDLWDANCMEEYHRINNFEEKAARAFDPDVEEFSFEQQDLHKEFCALFEDITEGYIKEHGYTLEEFYEESRRLMEAKQKDQAEGKAVQRDPWKDPPDPKEEADEIIDVIYQVSDFRAWADAMRDKAAFIRRTQATPSNMI